MRAVPGVTAAEAGMWAPLSGALPVEVAREPGSGARQRLYLNTVTPGLLPLLRVPVLQGRGFETRDNDERSEHVALLSRMAAAELFPGETPIGQLVHREGESYRIVGVVADVRQEGPLEDARPMLYIPFRQFNFGAGTFVITGRLEPAALSSALRGIVRRLDPDLPLDRVETLASIVNESLAQPRFYSVTVGVFGALALGLSVAGLYAVVAFAARRRTFEFGVRSALGARPADNLWLVYRQGLALSLGGVGAGMVLAFYAGRALQGLLYHTEPSDPAMLGLAASGTLLIALAAVLTPAIRAARVDPVVALRSE
jgi:ABC-type antimicrobial peptide transport system permease subunit